MRFPHLYGPLPVTAVIAVVPYRPPAPSCCPAPGDRARPRRWRTTRPCRSAGPSAWATSPAAWPCSTRTSVHSQDNNQLVLTAPVDADTVEAATDEVGGNAGWPHRAAALLWPGAGDVAADLRGRGWQTQELLLMARAAAPTRGGRRVEVVAEPEVHEFWARSWRRDLPDRPERERVVADLVGREQLNDRVVAVTDLVVREQGRVVASGQLRIDGATAAVDSVLTDPAARGPRARRRRPGPGARPRARRAGCDLVVLEAAADDWPRHWYARRGFASGRLDVGGRPPGLSLDRREQPTAAGRPPRPRAAASPAGP